MKVNFNNISFKKFFNKKVIISLLLVICIIGTTVFIKVKFLTTKEAAQNTVRYTALSKMSLSKSVSSSGNIKSAKTSSISSSLGTVVKQINVKLGDTVKAGDVIAIMDTTELEAEISTLQTNLETSKTKAQANVNTKLAAYEAAQAAYNASISGAATNTSSSESSSDVSSHIVSLATTSSSSGNSKSSSSSSGNSNSQGGGNSNSSSQSSSSQTPTEALAKAKSEYDSAVADYNSACSSKDLENKQAELASAIITAPFDGTITAVNEEVGQSTSGSLFEIQDLNSLIVDVNVSENDISKVQVGQKATIVVDAVNSGELEGEVIQEEVILEIVVQIVAM